MAIAAGHNANSGIETHSQRPREEPANAASRTLLIRIAALAALGEVAVAVIQAPIFILWPQPTTVLGHFNQFQSNVLLGLLDLDLMLIIGGTLSALVVLGLYFAFRQASRSWTTLGLTFGLGGTAFFLAVNPTFAMLYLSDQYAAAISDAQRSAFLAAGEALWANYNGTAFGLYFILTGLSTLIFAFLMLRTATFGRWTGYVGIGLGLMLLVPPLPPFGSIPLALSYVVIVPATVWNLLVARGLFRVSRQMRDESTELPVRGG